MRLSEDEVKTIKRIIFQKVGKCDIYIFGSRLNDNLKGGDVDIFIDKKVDFDTKIELKILLEDELFLPVDIVSGKDKNRLIEKEAKKGRKI